MTFLLNSKDFVVFLFEDTFEYGKCLETGETTKSLEKVIISRDFVVLLFPDTFEYRKCPETGETTKSLEKSLFQRILLFYCF